MYNFKPKICEECGKEFIPTSGCQKVCIDCKEEYYSGYYAKYYQEHKARYTELRLRNYHKKRQTKTARPIVCEGYAERQKADTIAKYARVVICTQERNV